MKKNDGTIIIRNPEDKQQAYKAPPEMAKMFGEGWKVKKTKEKAIMYKEPEKEPEKTQEPENLQGQPPVDEIPR